MNPKRSLLWLGLIGAVGWQTITSAAPCPTPTGLLVETPLAPTLSAAKQQLLPQPKGPLPPGIARQGARVDLSKPSFSNPTRINNPLFPVSQVVKTLLLGKVDGLPLHVEYTLLPGSKTIRWNGQEIKTLEVQYSAHLGGRVKELALDWYAQADDGSVWYFGEAVYNYEEGEVADTSGSWLAGRDGIPAMIMPANPQVGNVYRVENIPGLVFEEVTVKDIGVTVFGPNGLVKGAMIGRQLHMDGSYSNKTFAPGYGEFVTVTPREHEALALAVPTDALDCSRPAELKSIAEGAGRIFDTAKSQSWSQIAKETEAMMAAWTKYPAPALGLVEVQMSEALVVLMAAVNARQLGEARQAAIQVAQAGLDLELRHRPLAEIELARSELWSWQLLLDTGAKDWAAIRGDVVTLEWIWKRVAYTLEASKARNLQTQLGKLRKAADAKDLAATASLAAALRHTLRELVTSR